MSQWTTEKINILHEKLGEQLEALDIPKGSFEMRINLKEEEQVTEFTQALEDKSTVSPKFSCSAGFLWISCTF